MMLDKSSSKIILRRSKLKDIRTNRKRSININLLLKKKNIAKMLLF